MMVYWETAHAVPDQLQFVLESARQWQPMRSIRGAGGREIARYLLRLGEESRWAKSRANPSPQKQGKIQGISTFLTGCEWPQLYNC